MKKTLLGLATLATVGTFPTEAKAATSFTIEPLVYLESEKAPDPSVDDTLFHGFDGSKFGVSGFWWVTKDWAEFHAGPTFSPVPELTLALDLGVEQNGRGAYTGRYAAGFMFTPNDVFAASGMLEVNTDTFRGDPSGVWYDLLATATPTKRLTAGARGRRFVGIGPFVQLNVPEARSKLWVLWAAADPERPGRWPFSTGLVGLTLEL